LERALITGGALYCWQRRLLQEWFLGGRVPRAVDVPTGLGKTKIIVAWLIARALGVPLPRRLVYVVDRRAVVDQASLEASALVRALSAALEDTSISQDVRASWSMNLGLDVGESLPVSTLRGQFADNRLWMDRPHGSAIIVGTVDMVGSRLLFSGYGVSRGMRPVHAALLGCDAYIVLDEAHLVPPFEKLLEQVAALTERDRTAAPFEGVPAFALTALSATGRTRVDAPTFRLDDDDLRDPPVLHRLMAKKRLWLLPQVEIGELATTLAERAWKLAGSNRRVLVYSNSRKVAQEIEALLSARAKRSHGDRSVTELLVGERRVRERAMQSASNDAAGQEATVVQRFFSGAQEPETPLFLVATSAGEVGIDLDADDIVCDLVPWERMVQRFGRVNRRPGPGSARIEVVPSLSEKDAEDPVLVDRLAELKAPFESREWAAAADGSRDASPLALQALRARIGAVLDRATTPSPFYPELERAIVDAWALTSLKEHPGRPAVAPWLRGWEDQRPQTTLVWRTFLPLRAGWSERYGTKAERRVIDTEVERFFSSAPPHLSETLQAPTDRVAELIKKRIEALQDVARGDREAAPVYEPAVVVLSSANDVERIFSLEALKMMKADRLAREFAERTIVLDARVGGLSRSGLLDVNEMEPPITADGEETLWWKALGVEPSRRIRWGPRVHSGDPWKFEGFRWILNPDDPDSPQLWVEVRRDRDSTEGDAAITKRSQALDEHLAWTRAAAAQIAHSLDLPQEKRVVLEFAAGFHDVGKGRDLWQDAMHAEVGGRPYAKTIGGATPGALGGYRHEFGSLVEALQDPEIRALPAEDRDLILHLIAAHHGHTRPAVAPLDPESPPSVSVVVARAATLRSARLHRVWGAWGLAWWEALLRSADWSASRRVNAND
jgi:CRISPR-associated endonuclease/helicase Cas3